MRIPNGVRAESALTPNASRAGALHSHIHSHHHSQNLLAQDQNQTNGEYGPASARLILNGSSR